MNHRKTNPLFNIFFAGIILALMINLEACSNKINALKSTKTALTSEPTVKEPPATPPPPVEEKDGMQIKRDAADKTYLRLVGNEGSLNVKWDKVTLTRNKAYAAVDDPLLKTKLNSNDVNGYERKKMVAPDTTVFKAENGYKGAHYDHFHNFFTNIRTKTISREDALFGYRAAAPALLCNDSYFRGKAIKWDPIKLKLNS